MSMFFIWVLLLTPSLLSEVINGSVMVSWCPNHGLFQTESRRQFEPKTDRFMEFDQRTKTWVEVELPYDLVTCVNDNCTKVGSIKKHHDDDDDGGDTVLEGNKNQSKNKKSKKKSKDTSFSDLGPRRRVSMTKMSETSIWITGESGSIYERFWNGFQWVLAPHDLPYLSLVVAEHATSVFIVNHTILAVSQTGYLYQMQLSESSQPIWAILVPVIDEKSSQVLIKSGVVSGDGRRVYFCTKDGTLLELSEIDPPRWLNHGQPPGANVEAIADAGMMRSQVVYSISSIGDLYEYDRSSKPLWKKHIWRERSSVDTSLQPLKGTTLHGSSLFLLTKDGKLVERRLQQRKWKWVVHGKPKDQILTSITQTQQDDSNEKLSSLFLTTSAGSVFEYRISKNAGNSGQETWTNHKHPPNARAARGVSGLQFQTGRILFPLDDGRLAELHSSGIGGENSGPGQQINARRKSTTKYLWTVLEAPETEGWNGEYCTEELGPTNCVSGIRDESTTGSTTRRKKGNREQDYIIVPKSTQQSSKFDENSLSENLNYSNFRLRLMQSGRSFFLITENGFMFECLYSESSWIWLRHENPEATIRGSVGNYNGSLYVVDENGNLLIRERSTTELAWINCTALRKGKRVIGGSPWDSFSGRVTKVTAEDSLFFVGKNGRLLQLVVALRKFKWKDCKNPPNTRVASIVDQELFRANIVFVVGANGRLYQYNKVTELWHEHYQSRHLVLSQSPGTAMRPSTVTCLTGSIFMVSIDGGLVEYHWNAMEGWDWVEHGAPHKGVALVGSLGPSFEGKQLFSIGSDGNVYLRYMDQMTWKWKNCGFPYIGHSDGQGRGKGQNGKKGFCVGEDFPAPLETPETNDYISLNCDPKIASVRPIPFNEDSVIFELRDGRLAELKQIEGSNWEWSRTIGTPVSLCLENYWTALAS